MPQIFHPSMNTISRVSIFGAGFGAAALVVLGYFYLQSPNQTAVGVVKDQPIPFSHAHHSGELGIDCRYCHTSVEQGASANVPPTYTCMSCHSQIWTDSPTLAPVRNSLAQDKPIEWERVHDLPDFVYFNHSIHVNKGVGCVSCHGRVDKMPLVYKAQPMTMQWCLECHREPEKQIRPREEVFNMEYALNPAEQLDLGKKLVKDYDVHSPYYLTNCSVCHR